jgi:hypothetical protein
MTGDSSGPAAGDENCRVVGSWLVMPENEDEIRTLIDRWAGAVHTGDMDGVLADHARDIVMFDVPSPYEGVRGLDASYAASRHGELDGPRRA